jgi:hypothetical protein
MQTNIEMAAASGRMVGLPVTARRGQKTFAVERPTSLFTLVKEVKRAERWETMVWAGIAIAAVVLLVMSLAIVVGGASSATVGQAPPRAAETTESIAPERLAGTLAPPLKNKFVTDAMDGEEMFGRVPVVAEFFSELNDDLVESAGGAEVIVTPYVVEQSVTGENFAGVSGEELKELKFFCGEFLDGFAAAQLKSFRVDGDVADVENFLSVLFGGGSCAGTTKEGVNSGEQFADAEGLGDVVVSAEIQSDDFVDFLTFRSQHQNGGRIFLGAELFAYVVPAGAREHDVKDDQGRVAFAYCLDGFIATVADGHVKTVPFHDFFQSEENVGIIFDDENPGFHRGLKLRSVVNQFAGAAEPESARPRAQQTWKATRESS